MMRWLWAAGGWLALALGGIGIVLPLLPTVPFVLLAAFCFARSSPRLHRWLLSHPRFGPAIAAWERNGAIGRRAKILASVSMAASVGVAALIGLGPWLLAGQAVVLIAVGVFIWLRPEP